MVTIKAKREIELMREAGRVTALTHKAIEDAIKPGMTTADLDRIAEETMKKYGAVSAEKGYDPGIRGVPPYPAATCISINDEVPSLLIKSIGLSKFNLNVSEVIE